MPKIAFINACGYREELKPVIGRRPSPLFRVGDRPILHHVIEALVQRGVQQCHIILHHLPYRIEDIVGGGERWGIEILYHLAKDLDYPLQPIVPVAKEWGSKPVLLAMGDVLPLLEGIGVSSTEIVDLEGKHTGWGVVDVEKIAGMSVQESWKNLLQGTERVEREVVMSTRTFQEVADSNARLLNACWIHHRNYFPTTSHEVEPGIWISRGVSLHPSAKLDSPLFLGENCSIHAHAHIGPCTIVEEDSVVDARSSLSHSLIGNRSYVGEELEVAQSIVDHNTLINLPLDAKVRIDEEFILSRLSSPKPLSILLRLLERVVGLAGFFVLSPLLGLLALWRGIKRIPVVQVPCRGGRGEWTTFSLLQFGQEEIHPHGMNKLLWLYHLAMGQMSMVGVRPVRIKELEQRSEDWQALYSRAKLGIFTLEEIEHGRKATEMDRFAAESYYAVHSSPLYDIQCVFRATVKGLGRRVGLIPL